MEHGITIFHKDENLRQKQKPKPEPAKPKRGPLNVDEQLELIAICKKHAKYNVITQYTSHFWIAIEIELQAKIGRRYSHYSCRRRINEYIAQRTIHRDACREGLPPPFQDMPRVVALAVDEWMNANDMEEIMAKIKKRDAIAKLNESSSHLAQTTKLQRVADWIKGIPDPDPTFIHPRPFTGLEPSWHFLAQARAKRLCQLSTPAGLASATPSQSRPSTSAPADGTAEIVKKERESPAHAPPVTLQGPAYAHPAPLTPRSPLSSRKRPLDDEATRSDRATQRPRLDPLNSAPSELKTGESARDKPLALISPDLQIFNGIDTVFGKFWENMAPYFKEQESRRGLSLAKSESIMHELFKDVGSALVRAFIKLEKGAQP